MAQEWESRAIQPLAVEVREASAGAAVRRRATKSWEFIWVREGEGTVVQRGASAKVGPGSVVLRWPGHGDVMMWDGGSGAAASAARWVVVRFEVAGEVEGRRREWPLAREAGEGSVLDAMLRWAWVNRAAVAQEPGVVASVIAAMVGCFVSGLTSVGEPPCVVLPEPVTRALDWMRAELAENPRRRMTNAEIAEAAGCSPAWAQVLFKRHLGCYPVQLARRARLDRAIDLLRMTNDPVEVVAAMAGFAHAGHMSRWLRRHVGLDATRLRQRLRAGTAPALRPLSPLTGTLMDLLLGQPPCTA